MSFTQQELADEAKILVKFTMNMTRNRDDAHDLCQETLLRAWDKRDKFVDDGNPNALRRWLITIARNYNIQGIRRHKTQAKSAFLFSTASPPIAESKLFARDMFNVLKQLSARQRSCLVLVDMGEMTLNECGKYLNLPEGSVKSIRSRARNKAARLLNDERVRLRKPTRLPKGSQI